MKTAKYVSNYLSVATVKNPAKVTIQSISEEELGPTKEKKIVVYFKELDQGLVLPKAVLKFLIEDTGMDETDSWIGKKYELFVDNNIFFQGKKVGGLRLRTYEE